MKSIFQCMILSCVLLLTMCGKKTEQQPAETPPAKDLKVVFISGSNEYVSHITLKAYKEKLESEYPHLKITILQADGPLNEKAEYSNLEGTDALNDCDLLLTFVRRTTISGKAIDDIRKYVTSGRPLVALRTSSHGFQAWPEFDKDVLGGNYNNHYKGEPEKREIGPDSMAYVVGEPQGEPQSVKINADNKDHPVLQGVTDFVSKYSLYKTAPIASDATLLLTGETSEGKEPLAWTREKNGRVVYIALGGVQDWNNPVFVTLVTNALFWAAEFDPGKTGS